MNTQQHQTKKLFNHTKDYGMLGLGILSVVYLLNFTFGFIEFLPDALPFLGNIDEAVATTLLISVLQYFGVDITRWFKRK